jgi:hypothetical protein
MCPYHQTGVWPRGGIVDLWGPERILEHLRRGWIVPHDWRERLAAGGHVLPTEQLALTEEVAR